MVGERLRMSLDVFVSVSQSVVMFTGVLSFNYGISTTSASRTIQRS